MISAPETIRSWVRTMSIQHRYHPINQDTGVWLRASSRFNSADGRWEVGFLITDGELRKSFVSWQDADYCMRRRIGYKELIGVVEGQWRQAHFRRGLLAS